MSAKFLKIPLISILVLVILTTLLIWQPDQKTADTLTGEENGLILYCAAGIKPAIVPIVAEYKKLYKENIQLQFGGSGTLLSNVRVAGKGDIYLAGDASYVDKAASYGLTEEIFPLATMTPVIAVKSGNPHNITKLADLTRADIKVAIGNPEAAAIGRISKKTLEKSNLWKRVEANVTTNGVFKPTVPELAIDVKIGAVDAAIVWDSTVKQIGDIQAVNVPELARYTQNVTAAVLKSSQRPTSAIRFLRYMSARDRGLKSFSKAGFNPVKGDKWAENPKIVLFSGGVNRVAIQETLKEFETREGIKVNTTYNGCGILVGQIKAGQRPDAYFACDSSYMTQVLPLFDPPSDIAETDMVLLVAKGNPKKINDISDLTRSGIKVGVANPEYSALGGLTVNLLKQLDLYTQVKPNITYGDAPTADMLTVRVKTGREDVAIVYRANTVKITDELDVVSIKSKLAKATQPIAVGANSDYPNLMRRLVNTLKKSESKEKFENSGFRWRVEE